ncbi:putative EMP1-like protein, partial [Plasmodium gaboni]
VLFPPRRKGMCTSNLENLNTDDGPLNDSTKVNNSFFGDILLTAKNEAQSIIDQYKEKNQLKDLTDQKDKTTVCNALKYSFADLGDIIRGRDLWSGDNNTEMKQLQDKLKEI